MVDLKEKFLKWESLIRGGHLEDVRGEIRTVPIAKLRDQDRLKFANLCRRVQLFSIATKALFPVIRESRTSAQPGEVAEYCASLIRIGSLHEARSLMSKTHAGDCPELELYTAFTHIVERNGPAATIHLKRYLEFPTLTEYQSRVAKVNLAAAYVESSQHEDGIKILEELTTEPDEQNNKLIYANCLELLTEIYVQLNDDQAAQRTLSRARAAAPSTYHLHHLRLEILLARLKSKDETRERTMERFEQLKTRAREINEFELLRNCDFFLAQTLGSENAWRSVYFGTPYAEFKAKALSLRYAIPSEALVRIAGLGAVECMIENRNDGYDVDLPQDLKAGKGIHNSLTALTRDFYRPQSIGGFFEHLYPKTYFDPFTAPNRIHQAVFRLRTWIAEQGLGWDIRSGAFGVVLANGSGLPILLRPEARTLPAGALEHFLEKLRRLVGDAQFSGSDMQKLNLAGRSQGYKYLQDAILAGLIVKSGSGRYALYSFAPCAYSKAG